MHVRHARSGPPVLHAPCRPTARGHLTFCSVAEAEPAVRAVTGVMAAQGFPERDRFGMRLALEEAVVNAVTHGNREDPGKRVRLSFRVGPRRALVRVADQGPGFDPEAVPDPTAPENLERACGRGLLLMRHYMTRVRYNRRGNAVTLCKRRSDGE